MVLELKQQVALVTGASSGIGKAIALRLAAAGAAVVVNAHSDKAAGEAVVEQIRSAGGRAVCVQADVSREEDVHRLFHETLSAFGALDILVNNAGIQDDAEVDDMELSQWQKVIGVNLTGYFLCAREAVKIFRRQGQRPGVSASAGKVICISSVHDLIPWAGHLNYAASKGGVMLMMKTLAQEVAKDKIRVNSICPGAIKTEINREAWDDAQRARALLALIPYGRIGEPDDVAKCALWLASDASEYITGASIYIDGGMTLYPAFRDNG